MDLPVAATNFFCVIIEFSESNLITAISFNVHFKVSFWTFETNWIDTLGFCIILFRNVIHMHISILQLIIRSHQQITEKLFQILCCRMNSILQIIIIGSNQSISEIPGMFFERIIIHFQSECLPIFNNKNSCCSCISLRKRMNLPDIRSKFH